MTRQTLLRLTAVGLGALLLATPGFACGGGGSSGDQAGSATAVDAFDFGFEPASGTVEAGQTVSWTNTGQTTHTVKGPGFFSRAIEPGQSYRFTFRKPGTYKYVCTLHPTMMRGSVTVQR